MFSALYSQCRNCLLLAEGGGQSNGWSNYGDGFTTDARRIAQIRAYMRTRGQTKYASAVPFFQKIHNANYRRNIVLSPHIYCPRVSQALDHWQGTGLYEKLHFSFGDKQRRGFTYRGVTRRYPIINGEFGSTLENNVEKSCMRDIAKYMNNRQGKRFDHPVISSWFYWTWNADSADTGGILNSDWRSIAWQRVRFLSSNLGLRPWYRYDYRLA